MSAASQVSQQNARRFALVARATIGRDSTQQHRDMPMPVRPQITTPNTPSTDTSFAEQFSGRILRHFMKAADKLNWSATARALGTDYVHSLVQGNGIAPEGLTRDECRVIEQRFSLACHREQMPEGAFPGQYQPWYAPTREQAMQFWHSRRKNRSRTRRHHRVAPSAA